MKDNRVIDVVKSCIFVGSFVLIFASMTSCSLFTGSKTTKQKKAEVVSEEPLALSIDKEILPYFRSGRFGEFLGVGDIPIKYVVYEPPNALGAIVVANGRTESYAKYAEVIYDLRNSGFSLYLIDHRGQGFSGRMLEDPKKGYVENFRDYVSDFDTFLRNEVSPKHDFVIGLAHSMGGAILALHILDNPGVFDAAIFHAPMWQIDFGPLNLVDSLTLDEKLVSGALALKDPTDYAAGGPTFGFTKPFSPENVYTGSKDRYEMVQRLMLNDFGDISLGGPTKNWIIESIAATSEIRERASEISIPIMLLQPTLDEVVLAAGQNKVCEAAKQCTKIQVDERHETFVGAEEPRSRVMKKIEEFLRSQYSSRTN